MPMIVKYAIAGALSMVLVNYFLMPTINNTVGLK